MIAADQAAPIATAPPVVAATPVPEAPVRREAPVAVSRMVAPKIVAPPQVDTRNLEREAPRDPLSQLGLALPPPPRPLATAPSGKFDGTSFFRPVATQSTVFQSMDRTVTIAGTQSLSADETCQSAGVTWGCGIRARSAFRLWLRGRALVCKLPPDADGAEIVASCRLGKQDVGAWLVSNGWARAADGGPYVQAAQKARAAHLGIFGDPPDTSGLSAVPSAPAPAFEDQQILAE